MSESFISRDPVYQGLVNLVSHHGIEVSRNFLRTDEILESTEIIYGT